MVEVGMVGWHHRFNENELGQTLGDGEGQGGLVSCSPWGRRGRYDLATESTHTHTHIGMHVGVCLHISCMLKYP